jgi:hypothetical protein
MHTGFWWGDLREGDHLGDPGVDRRIILKWIFKKSDGGMEWIKLARHSSRSYPLYIAAIRPPSKFLQALSSHCVIKNCSNSFGGRETLSVSQCRPEDNSSALFFDSSGRLMRSEISFYMILRGPAEVIFRKNSGCPEVDGCGVSSGVLVFFSSSSESREKLSEDSGISRPSQ